MECFSQTAVMSSGWIIKSVFLLVPPMDSGTGRGIPFHSYQPDWILGVLLLCFILVAWIQVFYRNRMRQLFLAPFRKRYMSLLVREGNLFTERISVALGALYLLTVPLLLYMTVDLRGGTIPGSFTTFGFYLALVLVLLAYWLAKYFMIRVIGKIFRTPQTTHEYILNIFIVSFNTALILLPLVLLTVYLKSTLLLYLSLALFGFSFLFRFVRSFLIGFSLTKFSYLFLFVYLCTLEILPLIVLAKFVLKYYY
jgi:hypothetical protein